MAKIPRTTQKIFCGKAATDELAVFGSMNTGNPIYTDDIEALQSQSYEEGWSSAIAANEAPWLEELNGVQYGLSKQIAYQFQEGIPEYDAGTMYFKGSWCKGLTDNAQGYRDLYESLTDNNLGNPLTSTEHWHLKVMDGANIDLSNLSESGRSILDNKANTDLSNLSTTGQAIIDSKADKDEIDGVWVSKHKELLANVSCNGTSYLTIDLSDYLPQDENAYELQLSSWVNLDGIANHQVACIVNSSLSAVVVATFTSGINQGATAGGGTVFPVDGTHTFTVTRASNLFGTIFLNVDGYRRIRT